MLHYVLQRLSTEDPQPMFLRILHRLSGSLTSEHKPLQKAVKSADISHLAKPRHRCQM